MSRKIQKRIQKRGRGAVFAPHEFLDLGTRAAVDQTLSRLARSGIIRRLGRGLYDYPRSNPRLGVESSPDPGNVARALARKTGGRLQMTGAQAANALGLSTQAPARIVYLTDGASRRIRVGKQTIEFRHAAPRYMADAGKRSGAVIQALRYLGKEYVGDAAIRQLRRELSETDKVDLRRGMAQAPGWMRPVIEEILRPEDAPSGGS